ncbi:SDR family oxidoreductase [Sphingobacterium sp. 2149]|uniref:SDR family NAD(P)-dependent oxidoreductase n=1 Tax=Sphingobacterium sp. 2149 TaxID=2817763 RepID=UPI001AE62EF9|nr:SDR family oxidoreductase [Sphingobacterium sp. 2149]MDR6736674.1 short-subunit dehydrogenase [Sphingobacterium sp. 2149]
MKTIAIVGAGAGLGLSIAKKFGENGFRIALIARNQQKLNDLVRRLNISGIEAAAFTADILDKAQIASAFDAIKEKYGVIDVLEYSPIPSVHNLVATLDVNEENALYQFQFNVLGAISSIREVLSDMLAKNTGALLFTTGGASFSPVPMMGNVGIAMAGLRNYVLNLNTELSGKGIYAGHIGIGIWMKEGSAVQDKIADIWYDMYMKRDRAEEYISEDKVK